MRASRIKAKISRDEAALGLTLHLTDPGVFELAGLMGFDAIWMDLEHHSYSTETAGQLMRAARVGGSDIVARPGKGEFMRMGRLLELGAQAIMYPRCDGPDEAAEVVRWAKFAPLGTRGFDGSGPDSGYSSIPATEYLELANRETLVIIQLEHQQAVDRAEAIAAVPGVDMIMLGPADFSILSGIPLQFGHAKVTAAMKAVAAAARNTGKHWACTTSLESAPAALDLGCRLLFSNADVLMVKNGMDQMQNQFASLGFRFENRFSKPAGSYLEK
jgi:4-hydroxy-2-oxoheptanedioate aldolase